jgi:acyl-CoA reductase-like NAD-dependent aldehyde dehydrogenase
MGVAPMFEGMNHINGRWQPAADTGTFEHRNPADLGQATGTFAASSAVDVEQAVAAAEAAFPAWRALAPQARKTHLEKALQQIVARREEIAATITRENGKTLREARAETDSAIKEMDYQMAEGLRMFGQTVPVETGGTLAYSTRVARGPVAVITPWNFPFNVPCRKCTPALMTGNTVVFKPASLTPQVGLLYTELLVGAGLPPGVFNCVTGSGGSVGGVVADPRIKAISFTGSTAVGKQIQARAAENLTPTQLELGGKNPAIVLPDADLDFAVAEIVKAAFACSGQWCTSTSRVIVLEEIAEELTARLLASVRDIAVGDGMDESRDMGPVCGAKQKADILEYIEIGQEEGARLLAGGASLDGAGLGDGCFIAPTVFGAVTREMTIAREEIFGPVIAIMTARTFEEAVDIANDVPYGLSSSIFTNDLNRALSYMERTEVGLAHVNLMSAIKEPQLSFGGIKESGAGLPEAGSSGIEFFTEHKVCYVKYR